MRHFFGKTFEHATLEEMLPKLPTGRLLKCTVVYSDTVLSIEFKNYAIPTVESMAVVSVDDLDYPFKMQDRTEFAKIKEFSECDEAIIIKNGFVTNATSGNLVFQDGEGNLLTPIHYILSGTKRAYYLKKKTITTYPIKVASLQSYDYVYLINSMIDLEDEVGISTECLVSLRNYVPKD
jgi:4-amino-4-deoxychorismate lyase